MVEITTQLVKKLIDAQFPKWRALEVRPVAHGGHDNRTFHLGDEMAVRLPSGPAYVAQVEKEAQWLPFLARHLSLPISSPVAIGVPMDEYPFPWSINRYIAGETTNAHNITDAKGFAMELASFLQELQSIDTTDAPAAGEHNFFRGASPSVYSSQVEEALQAQRDIWPVEKLSALWARAVATTWEHPPVWLHGDVAPGNLLVQNGSLCGVIDFGIMGIGDPACDYAMAWTFFDERSRKYLLRELDTGTIDRARGWALWKALITVNASNALVAEQAKHTLNAIIEE